MNVRAGASALLLLVATALASCGEGSPSSAADPGSPPKTATATPGATDPGEDATTPPSPVAGDIKACDVLTQADAERVIGGPVAHPGETDEERQAYASDTMCGWAPPGQTYIFDEAPAVVSFIVNDATHVQQFRSPENKLEKVDVAGYVGYLSPEKDNNTGYVLVIVDDDTIVQLGVVRVAPDSRANAELAAELGRTVLKRLG